MSKVVVISGHPKLDESNTNKIILEQLAKRVENIDIRRLDTLYPDYNIDVDAEQAALIKADVIVMQYPFYWYTMPALMKKWIDDVFSYNFAYGSKGDKLQGKAFLLSFTIGGPEESYDPLGYNHFSIEQFLPHLQQTAYLAGMNFLKPIYSHGMVYIPGVYNTLEGVQEKAIEHADRLIAQINALSNAPDNKIKAMIRRWFAYMDTLGEDISVFTPHIGQNMVVDAPEGRYEGLEGFSTWYQGLRANFKSPSIHQIEQILVKPQGEHFQAEIRVRLIAETQQGTSINLLVNELWTISVKGDTLHIHEYVVRPVND